MAAARALTPLLAPTPAPSTRRGGGGRAGGEGKGGGGGGGKRERERGEGGGGGGGGAAARAGAAPKPGSPRQLRKGYRLAPPAPPARPALARSLSPRRAPLVHAHAAEEGGRRRWRRGDPHPAPARTSLAPRGKEEEKNDKG